MEGIGWQNISSKCPNKECSSKFKFKQGGFPIENDSGGWKLKCKSCNYIFIIHVLNPLDLSYVEDGVDVLETREGTLQDIENWITSEGLKIESTEAFVYIAEEISPFKFELDDFPLYQTKEGENLEKLAYEGLKKIYDQVYKQNYGYFQWFVKGRAGEPKFCYCYVNFESEIASHTAVFYYDFSMRSADDFPSDYKEILLAHISNSYNLEELINGIYTRNNCLSYLNKLLIRWRGLYQHTVMVVPFVGYLNQNAKTRIDLWKDLKFFLKEPNCYLLTRHIAKSLLEKSEIKEGIPADLMKEFDVEHESFKNMALFNLFHAKYFAGVNEDETELLKGSFNIQKNSYLENIDFTSMNKARFQERYLEPLRINLENKEELKDAVIFDFRDTNVKFSIEFNYGSGKNLLKKFNI